MYWELWIDFKLQAYNYSYIYPVYLDINEVF